MISEEQTLAGVFLCYPKRYFDNRGYFQEAFKRSDLLKATGFDFGPAQTNISFSSKGVLRGMHWAKVPPGQAKFVTCLRGKILDIVLDIRPHSSTYGKFQLIELNSDEPKTLLIPNGIAHGFISLLDESLLLYNCDTEYNPDNEYSISPLSGQLGEHLQKLLPELGIANFEVSARDMEAPSLEECVSAGLI